MEQDTNSANLGLRSQESARLSASIFEKYKILAKGLFLESCAGIESEPNYRLYFENLKTSLNLPLNATFTNIHFNGSQGMQQERKMYAALVNAQQQYFQRNPRAALEYQLALKNLDLHCAVELLNTGDIVAAKELFDSSYGSLLTLPKSNLAEQQTDAWLAILDSIWQSKQTVVNPKYLQALSSFYFRRGRFTDAYEVVATLLGSTVSQIGEMQWSLWANLAKISSYINGKETDIDGMVGRAVGALTQTKVVNEDKAKKFSDLYADAGIAYLNIGNYDKAQVFLERSRHEMNNWLSLGPENIGAEGVNESITEIQYYQLENILKTAERDHVILPDTLESTCALMDNTLKRLVITGNFITLNQLLDVGDKLQIYFKEQGSSASLKLRAVLLKYSRYDQRPKHNNQISSSEFTFAQ